MISEIKIVKRRGSKSDPRGTPKGIHIITHWCRRVAVKTTV